MRYRYGYALDGNQLFRLYTVGLRNRFVGLDYKVRKAVTRREADKLVKSAGHDGVWEVPVWGTGVEGLVVA